MSPTVALLLSMASFTAVWMGGGNCDIHRKQSRSLTDAEYSQVLNREATCPPNCTTDCQELYELGNVLDGRYMVYISTDAMRTLLVYCDMEPGVGGWTVFQSRVDGQTDFYRNWTEYEYGFSHTSYDFWMGNGDLYMMVAQKRYKLRVDITDFNGESAYQEYDYFTVGSAISKYSIGYYTSRGTAGNSLSGCGMLFSTFDNDNDVSKSTDCSTSQHGAWWYNSCGNSNLNGLYTTNTDPGNYSTRNIYWWTWKNNYSPLKNTAMKFRPM